MREFWDWIHLLQDGDYTAEASADVVAVTDVVNALPVCQGLSLHRRNLLRDMALRFMKYKPFESAPDFYISLPMMARVAVLACIPVFYLGYHRLKHLTGIVLYPARYAPVISVCDCAGVVYKRREVRIGEAWQYGPVVLSWQDVLVSGTGQGINVVAHEIAHVLDMSKGRADGMPDLPSGMCVEQWQHILSDGFLNVSSDSDASGLNSYAAHSPGEFFAVVSEVFFDRPWELKRILPAVYDQLTLFYGWYSESAL